MGTPQYVFGKRVGARMTFAVEFEAYRLPDGSMPRLWNEWWGCLWLWVDGYLVGNPYEFEMVSIGLESLLENAGERGRLSHEVLRGASPERALEIVMDRDHESDPSQKHDFKPLESFEVLPGGTGPFFDGWQAILLERADRECFIYRRKKGKVTEGVCTR